jgi:hypothetical protein
MFIDVLERLFDVMGDRKYHDFALWFYKERSRNEGSGIPMLSSPLDPKRAF